VSPALTPIRRLFEGLSRTREGILEAFRSLGGRGELDEAALERLEASLLAADLGPAIASEILESVRKKARAARVDEGGLREAMREALESFLPPAPESKDPDSRPRVVLVVGVNGGGKTTTAGKLALRERKAGRSVLLAAADTFRAAGIEQLERWAERSGASLVSRGAGADPAAVVFDALRQARAQAVDSVIVDTAGRLHTKSPLMAELGKIARVAGREVPGAPHETLLVLDATTGQNGLVQAREFLRAVPVTGIVLAKLDGTAKGGIALAIHRELRLPVRYVGVGEGADDLLDFDPQGFIEGLLGAEEAA
jgi:fused signal recognition particle receptor